MRTEYKVGERVKVNGTKHYGTVAEVRGGLYRVDLDGRSGVVYFGASEMTSAVPVCIGCRTKVCGDNMELCLAIRDVAAAGDAVDAFSDGAIAGAFLCGMEVDDYEAMLGRKYEAAKARLARVAARVKA